MKKYSNHTLKEYVDALSARTPVPGGGSAVALVAALASALISMVAQYSIKPDQPKPVQRKFQNILAKNERLRKRLLQLVDADAEAYLKVVQSRHSGQNKKKFALRNARGVPQEVCRLCYATLQLTPFLAERGNQYLLSDVEVALELLSAAFHSAKINVEINQ